MSTVKCGHRDCYGYGHSKPLINYHSQKAPASVTTVVTEISGMRVNEKSPYNGGGAVQKKHAFLEEEEAGVYSARHGGNVQKHAFLEENAGVYSGHRGGTVQKHGGSAALTHQYKHEEESDSSEESGDESDCEEELAYGQQGTGGVQKHGYGEQKAYHHGGDVGGYGAFRHDSSIENHGYGGQQAYQDGGYGSLHHSTVQEKVGYGGQKAYQGDVAGHDALIQSRAAQKHGHGYVEQNARGLNVRGYQSQQRCLHLLIWPRWRRRWWL